MFSSEPITVLRRSDYLRLVVPSLAESLNFWAVALGFTLIRQSKSPCDEALAGTQATAVAELEVHDYRVLLIEQPIPAYQLPEPEIPAVIPLLFQVHDLEARLVHIRKAGYEAPAPRIITQGPREGWQVVTIHGPDQVVVELMQPG
ncbi:VOC family protein [Pseudomonas luteola]|uniref:VOC family protein n=1 Tax=Pseudomonas luteola TaxID=47886 RepID=UPI003A838314